MIIKNEFYILELNQQNGAIMSFCNHKQREFIANSKEKDLFSLYILDKNGDKRIISSNSAKKISFSTDSNLIKIHFEGVADLRLSADVFLETEENSPLTKWRMQIFNESEYHIDKIDFPKVVVPNDLIATGGTSRIFTPMMEGAVIEDIEIREKTYMRYHEVGYPARGWEGIYPGATPIQFMAYYDEKENGLYFAAHDAFCNPKVIEFHKYNGGIKLEFQLFPGVDDTRNFSYEFDMIFGVFEGDWYDAAEIYRDFIEKSGIIKLPRIQENKNLPKWIKESPIVVCYPVRGEVDSRFEETTEYYPFAKATDTIVNLGEELDSKMMPLLMHWEGTAPWAPPYVWPPYGGLDNFTQYITEIHNSGHYIGVYCSGIAWTQESYLLKSYTRKEDFEKNNLQEIMVKGPKGELEYSYVCGGVGARYDMCPACKETRKIAVNEFEKIVSNCDLDYIQFFDQNLGGGAYACYDTSHGHSYGLGKWNAQAMKMLLGDMKSVLKKYGKEDKILIGCEGNAAEPFVNDYVFNDSRHNINYYFGMPVPAYNYVFHEYVNNFMGNQNTSYPVTDFKKYPENVYYRLAYSFTQGDIITIVLKNQGKIHWDWCTPWDAPEINQEEIKSYIKNLNDWRKGIAKDALQYGKMVKPLAYNCDCYHEEIIYGGEHNYPSVQSCRYLVDGEKTKQIFVNYMPYEQKISMSLRYDGVLYLSSDGKRRKEVKKGVCEITIPKRGVIILEVEREV